MEERSLLKKEDLRHEFEEYKKFAFKGDMMKMAIAFILGGAFSKVVSSISENLMMPLLNFIVSKTGENWRQAVWVPAEGLSFEIGKFAAAAVDFALISIVLFFMFKILKSVGGIHEEGEEEQKPFVEKLKDVVLGDWFFGIAFIISIVVVVFSGGNWMAGVWTFVGMSIAVSWFQKRELSRRWKLQEEKLQKTEEELKKQNTGEE